MADIKQAAKWMQKGSRVKRYIWSLDTYLWVDLGSIWVKVAAHGESDREYSLSMIDLLADDWEVAE